ncbi:MAG: STAS domain-containing protein [Planctomycetota bacterium]|jgi:anti-anti-sigma regulatory factor
MTAQTIYPVKDIPDRGICMMKASGTLNVDVRKEFNAAADKLLASEMDKLVLDLTSVNRIFSLFFGSIVDMSKRAQDNGKSFSVMAKDNLCKLMEQARITELANIVNTGE